MKPLNCLFGYHVYGADISRGIRACIKCGRARDRAVSGGYQPVAAGGLGKPPHSGSAVMPPPIAAGSPFAQVKRKGLIDGLERALAICDRWSEGCSGDSPIKQAAREIAIELRATRMAP